MRLKNLLSSIALMVLLTALLNSCIESDKSAGSALLPGDHILEVNSTHFDIPVGMKLADSLQTSQSGYILFGAFKDAKLGTLNAATAFQIKPSITKLEYGERPQVRSLKLYITVEQTTAPYSEDLYTPQNIEIYEMKSSIDSTTIYNNSLSREDLFPNPIGTGGGAYFGGDSLIIELSPQYGQKLLEATQEERDSVALFKERYKGLYITSDSKPGSLLGGRINYSSLSNLYLSMVYRHIDSEKGIDKDSTILYFVSDGERYLNLYNHSSKGLEVEVTGEELYLEAFAGLKPYIDMRYLKDILTAWVEGQGEKLSNLIVAKGEIRLPFEYPEDYKELNYFPTRVFLCTRELVSSVEEGVKIYDPIDDIAYSTANGSINRSLKYYSLDISSYLQRLIQGKIVDRADLECYIAPIYEGSDYYSGQTYHTLQSNSYSRALLNGSGSEEGPQLFLTYTFIP